MNRIILMKCNPLSPPRMMLSTTSRQKQIPSSSLSPALRSGPMAGSGAYPQSKFLAAIRFLLLFLSMPLIAGAATPWATTSLDSGTAAGKVSAVAVDGAGRVHTICSVPRSSPDPESSARHALVYRMRASGSSGFTAGDDESAVVDFLTPAAEPVHISIDVTDDFTVQIAMVDAAGVVFVYERPNTFNPSWGVRVVSTQASASRNGGVSLRSRGDNGATTSAVAFTRNLGGLPGGVHFSEQGGDGPWSAPIDVMTGSGTGRSPVLVNTGYNSGPRMIVSFNATENRIQAAAYAWRAPDFTVAWRAPVEIAPAFTDTRVDAEARDGLIGVAFVSNIGFSGVRVHYASDRLNALGSWEVSEVARPPVDDPLGDVGFGPNVALAFDAESNPWVAYTHDVGLTAVRRTAEIHARRLLPGIAWEDHLVDTIPPVGSGRPQTDSISLDAGDNGDPALLYERQWSLGVSTNTFARPIADPWQLKPALDPAANRSNPALSAGVDGRLHLATVRPGGQFGFHVYSFFGKTQTQESVEALGYFRLIAMTSTPDGAQHLVAVRTSDGEAATGELVYSHRPAGGAFSNPVLIESEAIAVGAVEVLPIVLRSDQAGALYVLYHQVGTGLRLLKRSRLGALWEDQFSKGLIDSTSSMDLAVRGDGGFVFPILLVSGENSFFQLWTNIDMVTGTLTEELERSFWSSGGAISDVACMILPDGRPAGAWIGGGIINFLYPRPGDVPVASELASSGNFPDSMISMATIAGESRLFVYSSMGGGTLTDLRMTPIVEPFRYRSEVREVAQPQLELASVQVQPFSLATDSAGFPVIAMSLTPDVTIPSTIYLARPADALDQDGDGIPLLLEGAHCLNLNSPDPHTLLPVSEALPGWDDVVLRHYYRTPKVVGEFVYRYEASVDLRNWFEEVTVPDLIGVFGLIPASVVDQPGCWNGGVESRYFGGFMDENQRRFTRMRVLRDR
jgi:hypothetical protein